MAAKKTVTVEQIASPTRRRAVQEKTLRVWASARCTARARWKIPRQCAA